MVIASNSKSADMTRTGYSSAESGYDDDSFHNETQGASKFTGSSAELDLSSEDGFLSSERDEVKEVQKASQKDTWVVQKWRIGVTLALFITAFVVTFTSYKLLKQEERSNFETAFDQFSRTVSDAALGQQRDLREGLEQLGTFISAWANSDKNNESFPFVTLPNWGPIANNIKKQAKIESLGYNPIVWQGMNDAWANYSLKSVDWMEESHMYQYGNLDRLIHGREYLHPFIMTGDNKGNIFPDTTPRPFNVPLWQYSPPPISYMWVNGNLMANPDLEITLNSLMALQNETLVRKNGPHLAIPLAFSEEEHAQYHSKLQDSSIQNPHGFVYHPVHAIAGDKNSGVTGIVSGSSAWDAALLGLLPAGVRGIDVVIKNNCNQSYTYTLDGGEALYQGEGDQHETEFSHMEVPVKLSLHQHPDFEKMPGHCIYTMHIYPSTIFQESYDTNTPEIFAAVVATTFVLVAIAFVIYDWSQTTRNTNLIHKAAQSNSIVNNLFPDEIRDRLLDQAKEKQQAKKSGNLKTFLNDGSNHHNHRNAIKDLRGKPMADLFLETTVLFADISGFTAWSSVREPSQVFTLLETIYHSFDMVAKRRRVYKVETVGDCYVAVCGLPEARKDHATGMARFARDILAKMHVLTKELTTTLGPDTSDLQIRIGIHSGPVTAGVLRGERARFQLFGDTVNVCSRIEASGKPSFIHCSKETAELIRESGKESWLTKRKEPVHLAGKGTMETYWVKVKHDCQGSVCSGPSFPSEEDELIASKVYGVPLPGLSEDTNRLIDWNVEMLLRALKVMVAQRSSKNSKKRSVSKIEVAETPLEEVREIIALPAFGTKKAQLDPEDVKIPMDVVQQLHHLVSTIASMYNDNPFHNFAHASHVVMSVTKLMSRIVQPPEMDNMSSAKHNKIYDDHCYGITADPMIQFACAFSALIHDVDHVGVSNAQLVKEGVPIADKYKGRSVAEQNSLDLSWDLLMNSTYDLLRSYLFPTQDDLVRFRQLVVNSVMATDIVDKDMKALRNGRWEKAFKQGVSTAEVLEEDARDSINRKATIVIEHIIQASDISHTMQHWHVYRKWNQNLFEELYVAYLNGRMDKDPTEFWYRGEFGFFDFYIIPLTQKLKDCGVFGVSSDELLNYAKKNREEWELKGEEVVREMAAEARRKYGLKAGQEQEVIAAENVIQC